MILVNGDSRKYIYTNIQVFVLFVSCEVTDKLCIVYTQDERASEGKDGGATGTRDTVQTTLSYHHQLRKTCF